VIHFELEGLPPSANNAYFQKGHKRILTSKGRAYKVAVKTTLAQQWPEVLKFFQPDRPYSIMVHFFFEKVTNSKKAKTRYKRIDVSNRLKLLEDALTEACGYDDSQHMRILAVKEQVPTGGSEKTKVWAWCWEDEECLFDALTERTR
jgi:Holliday junction resolvase RusA-like endonuclease